jgi:hypothetical protein
LSPRLPDFRARTATIAHWNGSLRPKITAAEREGATRLLKTVEKSAAADL